MFAAIVLFESLVIVAAIVTVVVGSIPPKCPKCGKRRSRWDSSFRDDGENRISIYYCWICKSLFEVGVSNV